MLAGARTARRRAPELFVSEGRDGVGSREHEGAGTARWLPAGVVEDNAWRARLGGLAEDPQVK